MPNLQNLLNAWVKVNNKHVVFPKAELNRSSHGAGSGSGGDSGGSGAIGNNRSGVHPALPQIAETTKGGKDLSSGEDQEHIAIRRFNSRKHRRRLLRTNSATDLIREKAEKEKKKAGTSLETSSYSTVTSDKITVSSAQDATAATVATRGTADLTEATLARGYSPQQEAHRHHDYLDHDHDHHHHHHHHLSQPGTPSVKLKTTSTTTPGERSHASSQGGHASSQGSQNTIRHANHYDSSRRNDFMVDDGDKTVQSTHSESSLKWVAGFFGAGDMDEASGAYATHRSEAGAAVRSLGEASSPHYSQSVASAPAATASPVASAGLRLFPKPFLGRSNCAGCKALEVQMLKSQQDIEYLRKISIRNEYVCSSCGTCSTSTPPAGNHNSIPSHHDRPDPCELIRASERMEQVFLGHKIQLEQLTKEQSRWQHDMNTKMMELSDLCIELNEKNKTTEVHSKSLQRELHDTRTERDSMAGEIQQLHTKIKGYEKMSMEHEELKHIMHTYERDGLVRASKAIETRDKMISDLSLRLELALDTLELERQQQRQRRQIMFPSRPGEKSTVDETSSIVFDELKKTKEELRRNQSLLESTKIEAKKREMALAARCDNLEKQLNNALS